MLLNASFFHACHACHELLKSNGHRDRKVTNAFLYTIWNKGSGKCAFRNVFSLDLVGIDKDHPPPVVKIHGAFFGINLFWIFSPVYIISLWFIAYACVFDYLANCSE